MGIHLDIRLLINYAEHDFFNNLHYYQMRRKPNASQEPYSSAHIESLYINDAYVSMIGKSIQKTKQE